MGRIKVGMGINKPLYKPILTPALSSAWPDSSAMKERVVAFRGMEWRFLYKIS
jgi:hypothetical protein